MADELLAGTVSASASASAAGMDATRELETAASGQAVTAAHLAFTVANPSPAGGAARIAPGATFAFDLYGAHGGNRVWDFEDGVVPEEAELCTPANGWTHTDYNGGSDNWDIFQDGATKVLRAQGKATATWPGAATRVGWASFAFDLVVRVRWYTNAQAGIITNLRSDAYGKTSSIWGYAAEIDSGGLRTIFYNNGTRTIKKTAAFSPVSGTWYYIRFRVQSQGAWNHRFRAKYWTGARDNEPSSWSVAWDYAGLTQQPDREKGFGVRNNGSGDAYFDDFEIVGLLSPTDTAKLTVELNGKVHSIANGNLRIEPFAVYPSSLDPDYSRPENAVGWYLGGVCTLPDPRNWRVEAFGRWAHDDDGSQTAVIKWDGSSLETISWSTSSFPGNPPEDTGAGDPTRIDGFRFDGQGASPAGRKFQFLAEAFLELMGRQDGKFAIAPVGWRAMAEEFRWIAIVLFSVPVDGVYTIAHPIEILVPGSLIPGEPKTVTIPGSIIPKGSLGELFPGSLVVQGYRRTDFPGSLVVGVRFFYRGKASGIVGEELLERIKASGIVLEVNADNELDLQVMDEATYQALQALGVTWT